jgi:hypothetical protein
MNSTENLMLTLTAPAHPSIVAQFELIAGMVTVTGEPCAAILTMLGNGRCALDVTVAAATDTHGLVYDAARGVCDSIPGAVMSICHFPLEALPV